jgi:hypothetical protein
MIHLETLQVAKAKLVNENGNLDDDGKSSSEYTYYTSTESGTYEIRQFVYIDH